MTDQDKSDFWKDYAENMTRILTEKDERIAALTAALSEKLRTPGHTSHECTECGMYCGFTGV